MLRKLLIYVVPIALPFVLYALYLWLAGRRARAAGGSSPGWHDAPWTWLGIAAASLMIVTLLGFALLTNGDTEGTYVPPRLIDGKIAPAEVR